LAAKIRLAEHSEHHVPWSVDDHRYRPQRPDAPSDIKIERERARHQTHVTARRRSSRTGDHAGTNCKWFRACHDPIVPHSIQLNAFAQ
jgi:hypothetical protein